MEPEATIQGLGEIYKVDKPFDESLKQLNSIGIKYPISARDIAFARMQEGKESSLCTNGNYIKEGVIYIPNKKDNIILVRNSPIIRNPEKATQSHRNNKEYLLSKRSANNYLKNAQNPKKDSAIVLSNTNLIPTNKFKDEELTVWLFQDQAEDYGLFLRENNINEMPLYFDDKNYIKNQEIPYANQLWLGNLDNWSDLNGYRDLGCSSRVRGVQKSGEASALENSPKIESYTPKEISETLKSLKLSGLEEQILKELRR